MPQQSRDLRQGSALNAQILRVRLDRIKPNPQQPRKHFDQKSLAELACTVKSRGILQPIVVKQQGKGYLLVAGERRLKAARLAGLAEIPAVLTDQDPLEISLIENLQRRDLHPIEEAEGYKLLGDQCGYTHEQIAEKVGKSRYAITESLALTKLPDEIKRECGTSHNYSKCLLLQVAREKTRGRMLALWEKVKDGGLTVREARREAEKRPSMRCRSVVLPPLRTINRLDTQLSKFDCERLTEKERERFGVRLVAIIEKIQETIDRLAYAQNAS